MKLEEIVGYLPHGLKILNKYGDQEQETITAMLTSNRIEYYDKSSGFELSELAEIKLLLHPLSDLTKPITVDGYNDGKAFVPVEKHTSLYNMFDEHMKLLPFNSFKTDFDTVELDYNTWQILYKWHFDIHGLIERGEAIDINTLEGK